MNKNWILKGNIGYSKGITEIQCMENGYLVCENGICKGVFSEIPEKYKEYELIDCGNKLIIPGMTDLHVHAPQYTFRGLGMDMELLEWLNANTFPEEFKYQDKEYAHEAYSIFANDLKNSYTTRACVFATIHIEGTVELMDLLENSGVITYVGKVNMDRNVPENICEKDAENSEKATLEWLDRIEGKYKRTYPILTPRFTPSCSDELMKRLSVISRERNLRVQSHLSENPSEIQWVLELVSEANNYSEAYSLFDMLGCDEIPAIMAHCVYSNEDEQNNLLSHGTYIAHCPESNINVSSGIAPVRKFLDKGIKVGLGSDIAAGSNLSLFHAIELAVQSSKLYWRLVDKNVTPLKFEEVFYLATAGGGNYFGKVGKFEDGYEFDALVIDDSKVRSMRKLTVQERLERMIYQDKMCELTDKFVAGSKII